MNKSPPTDGVIAQILAEEGTNVPVKRATRCYRGTR